MIKKIFVTIMAYVVSHTTKIEEPCKIQKYNGTQKTALSHGEKYTINV